MSRIIVAGGGAAGMMAAAAAGNAGHSVLLLEKNEKLGKKLFITGKGRCNVTNACATEELFRAVVTNPRFLYSSFSRFTSQDMMHFLEQQGCPLKTERGNRVFPVSDKSADILDAMKRALKKAGVEVHLQEEVRELLTEGGRCIGVRSVAAGKSRKEFADRVIIATGGCSYPSTGSTGDGYAWAEAAGHKVILPLPALVPLVLKEDDARELQGLSLKNIEIRILQGKKEKYREFGEMLFTHFGVSGPVILSASSFIAKELQKAELRLKLDVKPALAPEQLDARILRDFEQEKNRQFKNSLGRLLPAKMIPVVLRRSGISPEKQVNEITRQERANLVECIKAMEFTITGLRPFSEAVITQGGVCVKEVNPSTMESKKMPGLFFAGEVLDVDAVTGGFNLQIAWSTGWAAGSSGDADIKTGS